jgi:hypothetical protein
VCDTLCVIGSDRALFAKNSDRPPNEPQVVEWFAGRAAGGRLRTQYLELADPGAHALLGSRPTWLWGLEHGLNEHGVAIGNEKIWTVDDPHTFPAALLGMDLVRLALERARTADDALDVLTDLLQEHGQGGSGEHDHDEPYFSSFLIADPHGGWIVETSARTWAARPVAAGAAISNRVSISTDWTRGSAELAPGTDFDSWRSPGAPTGIADHRLAATRATVTRGSRADPTELVATLRHHGAGPWGAPGTADATVSPLPEDVGDDWRGVTVCMHVRGYQATTASIVAELRADAPLRAWTCLGSPCVSVYIPVFPPHVPAPLGTEREWHRFARLRDRVETDGDALADIRAVLVPVEAELWEEADALHERGELEPIAAFAATAYEPVDAALSKLGV